VGAAESETYRELQDRFHAAKKWRARAEELLGRCARGARGSNDGVEATGDTGPAPGGGGAPAPPAGAPPEGGPAAGAAAGGGDVRPRLEEMEALVEEGAGLRLRMPELGQASDVVGAALEWRRQARLCLGYDAGDAAEPAAAGRGARAASPAAGEAPSGGDAAGAAAAAAPPPQRSRAGRIRHATKKSLEAAKQQRRGPKGRPSGGPADGPDGGPQPSASGEPAGAQPSESAGAGARPAGSGQAAPDGPPPAARPGRSPAAPAKTSVDQLRRTHEKAGELGVVVSDEMEVIEATYHGVAEWIERAAEVARSASPGDAEVKAAR